MNLNTNLDPQWVSVFVAIVYATFTLLIVLESRKSRKEVQEKEKKRIENKKMAIRKIISEELLINFKILIRIRDYVYNYIISLLKDMDEEQRKKMEIQMREIEQQGIDPLVLEPRGILRGDTNLQKLFIHGAKTKIPEDSAYKSIINDLGILEKSEIKIITCIYAELKEIEDRYSLISQIYLKEDIYTQSEASQRLINEMKNTKKLCFELYNIYKRLFNSEINEEKLKEQIEFLLKN